jgi:type II secretion system protein J
MTVEKKEMKHSSPTLLTVTKDKCSHGVTLLELLVAMVILAIVVASVYVAFNSSKQSWQVGETIVQKYQNARGALDMMAREMSVMYMTISNIYNSGLLYSTAINGSNGEFRFVAAIPADEHAGKWDLCKIGYKFDSTNKEIERAFDVGPDLTNFDIDSSYQSLVSNVISLGFKCRHWDGVSWAEKETWDSREGEVDEWDLPEAVEISLTVQDDKQLADPRTFTTIVRIPRSKQ